MVKSAVSVLLLVSCGFQSAMLLAAPFDTASILQIAPPKLVRHVPPVYPDDARNARVQGVVVVEATIGPDGTVQDAKVIESVPALDQAALDAVKQWQYTPTIVNGVAQPVLMTVNVHFSLSESSGPAMPPLVLARGAKGWALNGTPLPDDNVTQRLQEVMETAPQSSCSCARRRPCATESSSRHWRLSAMRASNVCMCSSVMWTPGRRCASRSSPWPASRRISSSPSLP